MVEETPKAPRQVLELQGQLVYRRALSKKLVFFDLEVQHNLPVEHSSQEWARALKSVELVFKAGDNLSQDQVRDYRDLLKLGDVVRVTGQPDGGISALKVSEVVVLERWKDCAGVEGVATSNDDALFSDTLVQLPPPPHNGTHTPEQPAVHAALQSIVAAAATAHTPGFPTVANQQPICKYWIHTGACVRGDNCPYAHPQQGAAAEVRRQLVETTWQRRRQTAAQLGDPHANHAARKRLRAVVFCDWLLSTYGREFLTSGSGVLDVAGGRGAVSFQLHTVLGIRCTTIDPRPAKLSKLEHKALASMGDAEHSPCPHIQAEFGEGLRRSPEHQELLTACSLVIGMHPDEATEPILQFTTQYGKPFAVVPCCVFPRLYPDRVLVDAQGREQGVVSHAELVKYLMQQGSAQKQHLAFQGRNVVVFTLPS